jgi:hypothetical protein
MTQILNVVKSIQGAFGTESRKRVWCRECGKSKTVDTVFCLATGWPKCCGYTMTIDAPTEALHEREE